ncbi:MAG: hypothetical protein P4L55_00160 [Syntrophobacteraceae bacterium]|nr:hypothetical protein [Syntrophobacteraceae bacterium]
MGELLAFKNARGGFVKRRMRKTLSGFSKSYRRLRDDLAMACVWLEEGNESQ